MGRDSKETLTCGGIAVAMVGVVVDIVAVLVAVGGVKAFLVGDVEVSFFFGGADLVCGGRLFLAVLLGLALRGWDTFFCTALVVEIVFFISVVLDRSGLGTYGVGTTTRGAAIVAVGGGEVEWVDCVSVVEEGGRGALVGFCCGEEQDVMKSTVVTSKANEKL
ncbi:hypothetical protein A9Q81_25845 [Gammaproteobacteria bacterium 42_54_T18]|nr:hypothetical protein A9Q81_25845 [Gammaproteobacteria bacterium 42_54_T18]